MKVAFTYNMAEPGGTRDTGKSLLEYMIQKSFVEWMKERTALHLCEYIIT